MGDPGNKANGEINQDLQSGTRSEIVATVSVGHKGFTCTCLMFNNMQSDQFHSNEVFSPCTYHHSKETTSSESMATTTLQVKADLSLEKSEEMQLNIRMRLLPCMQRQ